MCLLTWRKYALMALYPFRLDGKRCAKEFMDTSLCSRWPALSVITWCGMYRTRCIPLMSVTNAISGIIVVGALLQGQGGWVSFLSFIAVLIASINIFGGFTDSAHAENVPQKLRGNICLED